MTDDHDADGDGDGDAGTDDARDPAGVDPAADAATAVAVDLGERLRATGGTVAVAEGHTGGRVFARLTAVPGASDYADRAYCPYSYDALREDLAIPRETLDEHGVVAPATTRAMARAARDRADATWGLATTGVAGPTGGDPGRPVGTTFLGVAYAAPWESGASFARVERAVVDGPDRGTRLDAAAERALAALRRAVDDVMGADGAAGGYGAKAGADGAGDGDAETGPRGDLGADETSRP